MLHEQCSALRLGLLGLAVSGCNQVKARGDTKIARQPTVPPTGKHKAPSRGCTPKLAASAALGAALAAAAACELPGMGTEGQQLGAGWCTNLLQQGFAAGLPESRHVCSGGAGAGCRCHHIVISQVRAEHGGVSPCASSLVLWVPSPSGWTLMGHS